ncbi:MAG: tRNA uridine-5-carboxymethylaminomethyl(34) synthesis GTPase MnmE [Proteobacteria bacterium]|nr:tRNA uridine-5-carboxymethylaminomethyl(34) synthesis GTPase MnmE [Pseudomonadota bacterium]
MAIDDTPAEISADTIFALASAPGRAGIAVIRVSGPAAAAVLCAICGRGDVPEPRRAIRCRMVDPASNETLDDGLVLWFPGPGSFTGEDVAEFHIHGGRATVEAVTSVISRLSKTASPIRLADPGEFSKRAFLAGKIDLTGAEAIADLVDAETDAQRRQALAQLDGGLTARLEGWRADLIDILAHAEAWIDFPDEDLPDDVERAARARISGLGREMRAFLDDNRRGERLRDGLQIVLLGAPNAGKSSLLNALAARDAAIVSETAGTTRDVIEVHLDLGGWPVTLADTAGLRDAADGAGVIEQEGVRRALARAEAADLRLVVFDATVPPDAASLALVAGPPGQGMTVPLWNKTDLAAGLAAEIAGRAALAVSAKTGDGLAVLLDRLEQAAAGLMRRGDGAPLTRLRHRLALTDAADALGRAEFGAANGGESELVAEDLRLAARALGRVTGRVDVEDLLDVIFKDFCIGK